MKRIIAIALAVVMVLTLGSGVAVAGGLKLALHERLAGDFYFEEGSGSQVGWAILNTNADGQLIIETHLDNGTPNEMFDVWVNKFKDGNYLGDENLGTLTTNRKGKGNAHVDLNLDDYDTVQVVVKAVGAVGIVGYATAMQVVAGGNGAIRGECYDDEAPWLGEITYLANRSGGHLWFTPTADGGPYIAGHSYHNVYKLKVGDPSEWCIVPSVPDREPYNIIANPGEPVYYKIFDTTTDTQILP